MRHPAASAGLLLAVVLAAPASAQQPSAPAAPQLTMIGLGAGLPCAEWLRVGAADPEIEQWAFGFASALAATLQLRAGADPLAGLDAEAIREGLGALCRQRPHETIAVALARLVLATVP